MLLLSNNDDDRQFIQFDFLLSSQEEHDREGEETTTTTDYYHHHHEDGGGVAVQQQQQQQYRNSRMLEKKGFDIGHQVQGLCLVLGTKVADLPHRPRRLANGAITLANSASWPYRCDTGSIRSHPTICRVDVGCNPRRLRKRGVMTMGGT